jgi:hypothetical protein
MEMKEDEIQDLPYQSDGESGSYGLFDVNVRVSMNRKVNSDVS